MSENKRSILEQVGRGLKFGLLVFVSLSILGVIMEYDCSHEASSRSRVSLVQNDLRILGLAIESYHADTKIYPLPGIVSLTTPVQYLSMCPADPFRRNQPGSHDYAYWAGDGSRGWIVYSPGPDMAYDIVPAEDYVPGSKTPAPALINKTYDPTNGINSRGDIYRYKN